MFSVIIPNFNREISVIKAVNSVLVQTHKDFELIVVDDCSTDDSLEKVSQIADPRIRIVKLKKNSGAAAARNYGIEISKGEYISLLDSDDFYDSSFLEESFKTLESTPDNVGFMWTGVRYFENSTSKEYFWKPKIMDSSYLTFLHTLQIGTNSGITIKREVFKECGAFNFSLPAAEDTDFFLRITQKFDFVNNPKILVNIEKDNEDRLSKNFKKIALAYNQFLPKHYPAIENIPELKGKFYYKMMWLNYHLEDQKTARYFYNKIPKKLRSFKIKIIKTLYESLPLKLASRIHQKISS